MTALSGPEQQSVTLNSVLQAMLNRHVNGHFTETGTSSAQSGPRKSIEGAPARKRLKRAGVKLKFRELPFSARIFDFFDAGQMAGIRHGVAGLQQQAARLACSNTETITFSSRVTSRRVDPAGTVNLQIQWSPPNL